MTITYQEISRMTPKRGGVDITVEFTDSETGKVQTKTLYFPTASPVSEIVTSKINANKARYEFKVNPLNSVELENVEIKTVIKGIVQYIRNNPDCTIANVVAAVDTQLPDLPWKPEKITVWIKDYLQKRLKRDVSFVEFKTYVIGHKFSEVD